MKYLLSKVKGFAISLIAMGLLTGCSLNSLFDVDNIETEREIDRGVINSRSGAMLLYNGMIRSFAGAISATSRSVAIFTDELSTIRLAGSYDLDSRTPSMGSDGVERMNFGSPYNVWQAARTSASQARSLLRMFSDSHDSVMISNTYVVEGFSILMLGETMCSGVPLSMVSVDGDVSYGERLSTEQLMNRAISLFDSALYVSHDSIPIITLAKIGKARAWLAIGQVDSAFYAVQQISNSDTYVVQFNMGITGGGFWTGTGNNNDVQIINNEGVVGLKWLGDSAVRQDPRVPVVTQNINGQLVFSNPYKQRKYEGGNVNFVVANGIQARLIEAEYYLNNVESMGDSWLGSLNELRSSIGLADTTDPGDFRSQTNLLFKERAFWLYLTGSRLGDMRRLVREYGMPPGAVYPVGAYVNASYSYPSYQDVYVFSPPEVEMDQNSSYKGCLNTNP